MKFATYLSKTLSKNKYTHCFFLAGGNNMHFLESSRHYFQMVPFVHEVAATIAAEYFNEYNYRNGLKERAFVLVTAGPGLTNAITAIAGAYLESRELLIIGGQVKTDDLKSSKLRQRGIQEIDGISLTKSITKKSVRLKSNPLKNDIPGLISLTKMDRKGPVFLELPLNLQAKEYPVKKIQGIKIAPLKSPSKIQLESFVHEFNKAEKPVILLGAGFNAMSIKNFRSKVNAFNAPIQCTWNGINNLDEDHKLNFGRPNTWGQRYANIIIQQADLVVALGTRLSMQQTGFNWKLFNKFGKIVQVDLDQEELNKGHPLTDYKICCDANDFFIKSSTMIKKKSHKEWIERCNAIKNHFPIVEKNYTGEQYISPFHFCETLCNLISDNTNIIPCSSGGAFTSSMQVLKKRAGQTVISNKALASMGYGLSGAIGVAIAEPEKNVILLEGDGGFLQNLQELGTAKVNNLNIKIIIYNDNGYASIRMTQKNYFGGDYIGCDGNTGLGMPDFRKLAESYEIKFYEVTPKIFKNKKKLSKILNQNELSLIVIPIDPEQTYFPKISSRVLKNGNMESMPLHIMSPECNDEISLELMRNPDE